MEKHQKQVKEFHQVFQKEINEVPTMPSEKERQFRALLLLEEAIEFCHAAGLEVHVERGGDKIDLFTSSVRKPDLVAMADAVADIQYVNDGAALALGVDLEALGDEIHRSNMTKLWSSEEFNNHIENCETGFSGKAIPVDNFPTGRWIVKREDGKILKPPSYSPANIEKVLNENNKINTDCNCPTISDGLSPNAWVEHTKDCKNKVQ